MSEDNVLIAIAIESSISHQLTSKDLWATVLYLQKVFPPQRQHRTIGNGLNI